jgi:hypothetical protein
MILPQKNRRVKFTATRQQLLPGNDLISMVSGGGFLMSEFQQLNKRSLYQDSICPHFFPSNLILTMIMFSFSSHTGVTWVALCSEPLWLDNKLG